MKLRELGLVALCALAGCEDTGRQTGVVGTQQAFASGSASCANVGAGAGRTLAFGTSNLAGTALADTLGNLTTSLVAGGNYTIIATGTATNPRLLVLDNTATTATAGNANVRFVNATGTPVDFFATSGTTLGIPTSANIAANAAGTFALIPVTNTTLTFRNVGSTAPTFTSTGTFNAGQSYNVILFPNATETGFQALTVTRC